MKPSCAAGVLLAFVVAACSPAVDSQTATNANATIFEGARLITGDGSAPIEDSAFVVEKTAFSAFFPGSCALPALLERRGIDTVLVTGTVTNICCESSARDANASGFRVVMVADANAARRDLDHNAALHNIYRSFGDVRPTAEVLELLGADGAADATRPHSAADLAT